MDQPEAEVVADCPVNPLNQTVGEFMRYFVVGGIAAVADTATLFLLNKVFSVPYLWAGAGGFLLGLTVNYRLSTRFVFRDRSVNDRWAEFFIFGILGVMGLGVNQLVLWVAHGRLGIALSISKVMALGTVFFWSFGSRKVILFSRKPQSEAQEA